MRNILLLTSTIKPKENQPNLALSKSEDRLVEYIRSLEFYSCCLKNGAFDGIVYVDNSGVDLSCISNRFHGQCIEFISFYDLDYNKNFHRGYGEFRIIDHAFSNSSIIKSMGDDCIVWKITGRYIIKNIANIISFTPRYFDFLCDSNNEWVEMSLMAWKRSGYDYFIRNVWQNFVSDKAPELIFSSIINNTKDLKLKLISKYYWNPVIVGRRGSDGSDYQGKYTMFKHYIMLSFNILLLPFRYMFHK